MTKAADPPFLNGGKSTGASGGRDFTKESRAQSGAETGGKSFNGNNTGGRDFTKESRPQTDALKSEGSGHDINPQEVPAGGKDMKADPGPVSAKVAGTALGISPKVPWKALK